MFASCREAMVAHICGITSVVSENFNSYEFYTKHLGTRGNCYVDVLGEVNDDWARRAIADALTYFPLE